MQVRRDLHAAAGPTHVYGAGSAAGAQVPEVENCAECVVDEGQLLRADVPVRGARVEAGSGELERKVPPPGSSGQGHSVLNPRGYRPSSTSNSPASRIALTAVR